MGLYSLIKILIYVLLFGNYLVRSAQNPNQRISSYSQAYNQPVRAGTSSRPYSSDDDNYEVIVGGSAKGAGPAQTAYVSNQGLGNIYGQQFGNQQPKQSPQFPKTKQIQPKGPILTIPLSTPSFPGNDYSGSTIYQSPQISYQFVGAEQTKAKSLKTKAERDSIRARSGGSPSSGSGEAGSSSEDDASKYRPYGIPKASRGNETLKPNYLQTYDQVRVIPLGKPTRQPQQTIPSRPVQSSTTYYNEPTRAVSSVYNQYPRSPSVRPLSESDLIRFISSHQFESSNDASFGFGLNPFGLKFVDLELWSSKQRYSNSRLPLLSRRLFVAAYWQKMWSTGLITNMSRLQSQPSQPQSRPKIIMRRQ